MPVNLYYDTAWRHVSKSLVSDTHPMGGACWQAKSLRKSAAGPAPTGETARAFSRKCPLA